MELNFNWKYKDYELRAVPKGLVRTNDSDPNHTIELLKWTKDDKSRYCFTIAYWVLRKEGYELRHVYGRMFEYVRMEDLEPIWIKMIEAQQVLDEYWEKEISDYE